MEKKYENCFRQLQGADLFWFHIYLENCHSWEVRLGDEPGMLKKGWIAPPLLLNHLPSFWTERDLGLFLISQEYDQTSKIFWTGEGKQALIHVGDVSNSVLYTWFRLVTNTSWSLAVALGSCWKDKCYFSAARTSCWLVSSSLPTKQPKDLGMSTAAQTVPVSAKEFFLPGSKHGKCSEGEARWFLLNPLKKT